MQISLPYLLQVTTTTIISVGETKSGGLKT